LNFFLLPPVLVLSLLGHNFCSWAPIEKNIYSHEDNYFFYLSEKFQKIMTNSFQKIMTNNSQPYLGQKLHLIGIGPTIGNWFYRIGAFFWDPSNQVWVRKFPSQFVPCKHHAISTNFRLDSNVNTLGPISKS